VRRRRVRYSGAPTHLVLLLGMLPFLLAMRSQEMVRSVQQHARSGDALASQDVLSLAPDAIGLSADAALALPNSLLLLKTVDNAA
jgi:hypothetical protein